MTTVTVTVAEFQTDCLHWIEIATAGGTPITITRDGQPIARLVAVERSVERGTLFGYMAGTATVVGDIVSVPMPTWSAESDEVDPLLADLAVRHP